MVEGGGELEAAAVTLAGSAEISTGDGPRCHHCGPVDEGRLDVEGEALDGTKEGIRR